MNSPDELDRKIYYKHKYHGSHGFENENIKQIQLLYILAVIAYIIVIFYFEFYQSDAVGIVILLIPIFVFYINYGSVHQHSDEIEEFVLKGNFLSFGFLIVVIIINWSKVGDKKKLFRILLISLILIMLSLIDIWVRKDKILLSKHFRTVFQTIALVFLVFALYSYYLDQLKQGKYDENGKNKSSSDISEAERIKRDLFEEEL